MCAFVPLLGTLAIVVFSNVFVVSTGRCTVVCLIQSDHERRMQAQLYPGCAPPLLSSRVNRARIGALAGDVHKPLRFPMVL